MASPPPGAGHREFEAEAHWHLADGALARGQLHLADCRLVLGLAATAAPVVEAAASRTWTEIALAAATPSPPSAAPRPRPGPAHPRRGRR